jgi:hypothetical protein
LINGDEAVLRGQDMPAFRRVVMPIGQSGPCSAMIVGTGCPVQGEIFIKYETNKF